MASKRMKNGSCRNRHAERYRHIKQQSTSFRAKKEAATPRVDRENVMNNAGQHANWPLLVAKPEDAKMAVRRWKTPAKQGCRNGSAAKKKAGQKKGCQNGSAAKKGTGQKRGCQNGSAVKKDAGQTRGCRNGSAAKKDAGHKRGCQNGGAAKKDAGQTRG